VITGNTSLLVQKFGEMELEDYDSEEDADYCPSEASEDSDEDHLEYNSDAEESVDEVESCEEADSEN
jgi:hypothetical protein